MVISWMNALLAQPSYQTQKGPLGAYRTFCVLGYCLIPMSLLSTACLMVPDGLVRLGMALVCIAWSTRSGAAGLVGGTEDLRPVASLVAIPVGLYYAIVGVLCFYRKSK